jgi:hypothetical protein
MIWFEASWKNVVLECISIYLTIRYIEGGQVTLVSKYKEVPAFLPWKSLKA